MSYQHPINPAELRFRLVNLLQECGYSAVSIRRITTAALELWPDGPPTPPAHAGLAGGPEMFDFDKEVA